MTTADDHMPDSDAWRDDADSRLRILVADDTADMRTLLGGLLRPYADIDTTSNGVDALRALEQTPYDLLIADVKLPVMDGFELLRRVRESPPLQVLPVMLLSTQAGEAARAEALAAGAGEFLVKPFSARELMARIVSVIVLARARAEAALEDVERQVVERTREVRQGEAERYALRRQLSEAEEAERRRLARELHDQLGQQLTALMLGVADVRRLIRTGESPDSRLTQLEELARSMTRDARYLALELRPPELDDVGLDSALATYVDRWRDRYGVAIDYEVLGAGTGRALAPEVGTVIYRVAQEALTNVAKHAAARQATVLLDRRGPGVRLIVEDDGDGFEYEPMTRRTGLERRFGIAGMRERAAIVGGALQIETTVGKGTAIYLDIPG